MTARTRTTDDSYRRDDNRMAAPIEQRILPRRRHPARRVSPARAPAGGAGASASATMPSTTRSASVAPIRLARMSPATPLRRMRSLPLVPPHGGLITRVDRERFVPVRSGLTPTRVLACRGLRGDRSPAAVRFMRSVSPDASARMSARRRTSSRQNSTSAREPAGITVQRYREPPRPSHGRCATSVVNAPATRSGPLRR